MAFLSADYTLMTIEDLRQQTPLPVTSEDFLLGVADLTGEVMRWDLRSYSAGARKLMSRVLRYGINSVGKAGDPTDLAASSKEMAAFVRMCIAGPSSKSTDPAHAKKRHRLGSAGTERQGRHS